MTEAMREDSTMAEKSKPVEVSRRIEAPAALIFKILANPQRHVDFDGSAMLRGAVLDRPISDVGDNFDPIFLPEQPVYPDASRPGFISDPSWSPDTNLGFSGGSVFPFSPGSKFQIFDY